MQAFNNGDTVEYFNHAANEWRNGVYVGKHPNANRHFLISVDGHGIDRADADVRKPRVKKEGYINLYPASTYFSTRLCMKIFANEEAAKAANRTENKITIRIEWFE